MNLVPIVVESTSRGERAYDISSRLLKDRIIILGSEITESIASCIVAEVSLVKALINSKFGCSIFLMI